MSDLKRRYYVKVALIISALMCIPAIVVGAPGFPNSAPKPVGSLSIIVAYCIFCCAEGYWIYLQATHRHIKPLYAALTSVLIVLALQFVQIPTFFIGVILWPFMAPILIGLLLGLYVKRPKN